MHCRGFGLMDERMQDAVAFAFGTGSLWQAYTVSDCSDDQPKPWPSIESAVVAIIRRNVGTMR